MISLPPQFMVLLLLGSIGYLAAHRIWAGLVTTAHALHTLPHHLIHIVTLGAR